MHEKILEFADYMLSKDIYELGFLTLLILASLLFISVIILTVTFKKCKIPGKIIHILGIAIALPEAIYATYWCVLFFQVGHGIITELPF